MANKKSLKQKNQDYLTLSFWILGGLALVVLNYISLEFIKSVVASEVFGWTALIGGSVYLLAGLMILFMIDALYFILFMRRLFFGTNDKTNNTVYLP